MRALYLVSTALFGLAVGAIWLAAALAPLPAPVVPLPHDISAAELARHARAADCWMAIGGTVYDVTDYLPRHPSDPDIVLPWCGRDATTAYRTKLNDRPHSVRADALLRGFEVGPLAP